MSKSQGSAHKSRKAESLARRFSFTMAIVVAAVVSVYCLVTIINDAWDMRRRLHKQLADATKLAQISLPTALWQFNHEYVKDFADALFLEGQVVFAQVLSEGKSVALKSRGRLAGQGFEAFKKHDRYITAEQTIYSHGKPVGRVRIALSKKTIYQYIYREGAASLFLAALLVAAVFLSTYLFTRANIFRPIRALQDAAASIAGGSLKKPIPPTGRGEIGRLSLSLEHMRADLDRLFEKAQRSDELARLAEQLRQERDRAQNYLDVVDVMIVALAPDQTVSLINPAGCNILGYKESEILGKNWFDNFLAEEDTDQVKHVFDGLMAGRNNLFEQFENLIRTKKGEERLISWRNVVLRDDKDRILGTLSSGEDITERRRAQEALRQSQQRLITVTNGLPMMIAFVGPDGRFLLINDSYARWFGRIPEDVVGRTVQEVIGPDVDSILKEKRQEALKGRFAEVETPLRNMEGQTRIIHTRYFPNLDEDKKPQGYIVMVEDVTQRRELERKIDESEERLKNITDNMPDVIAYVDSEQRYRFANQAFYQWNGLTPEQTLGRKVPEALRPDAYETVAQYSLGALAGRNVDVEFEATLHDGRHIPIHGKWIPHRVDGRVVGYFVFLVDITEIKKAETERTQLAEQLRQAQKMEAIGTLAGGVAHDFNNILSAIIGYCELMSDDMDSASPHRENLRQVLRSAWQARNLVSQLLAFSRKQVLEFKRFHLSTVVSRNELMLRRIIGEDIELDISLPPETGVVRADFHQMEQVLLNLVANARDAMPTGGKVMIETANLHLDANYAANHPETEPGNYVMLAVSDNGPGMSPDIAERIFDPFFTTKQRGKGTGLGLAMVYGIIKQHKGSIYVYSEPGGGTTFKIYLPQAHQEPDLEVQEYRPAQLPMGSETILVVEDDEVVREFVCQAVSRLGYRVLRAADGQEALDMMLEKRSTVDLLLTDVIMPRLSGKALYEALSPEFPELKVLYISGYTDNAIAHHGVLDAGVAFLQKPVSLADLAKKVRLVLDS